MRAGTEYFISLDTDLKIFNISKRSIKLRLKEEIKKLSYSSDYLFICFQIYCISDRW